MFSSRDSIVRAEEEDRDSLACSEDSLKDKTTVTAIGKVNQICNCQTPATCADYVHASGKHDYCLHGFRNQTQLTLSIYVLLRLPYS